jgi:tetratricopeptide (TPR) repeat protein
MPGWATASSSVVVVVLALAFAAPAHAQRPGQGEDDSAAFVDEGRAALRKRDYARAGKALDEAIRINPRRLEAYVLRAAVYSAKQQHAAGVALMRKARALAPDDVEVMTALGTQLVLAGEPGEGVPLLRDVVAREPGRYDAHLVLGGHLHATGLWAEAVTAFEAYFAARPADLAGEDGVHQIVLADSYLRDRRPRQALDLFQRAQAARPKDVRAKLGVAWATAATDCRKARPLLGELRPIARTFPEIWLVDGRCALALGDTAAALDLGRRYLDESATVSAAGHALVGEAEAARGDLPAARTALRQARKLEPGTRRWSVRLANVLRRAGEHREALEELEEVGAPAEPALDADWWAELALTLIAKGDAAGAATRLEPVIGALSGHAPAQAAYGEALARTGKIEAAVAPLETAEKLDSTARSRRWLAYALGVLGTRALADDDAAAAEAQLARATALAPTADLWKNLGVARLALGTDAVVALDKAIAERPDPATYALLGRARGATDPGKARAAFAKALELARGSVLVDVAIDAAAFELAAGEPGAAVEALERAVGAAKAAGDAVGKRHAEALLAARHAAGLAALRAGAGQKAVEHLAAAAAVADSHALRCDLAVASVVAGDRVEALRRLKAVEKKACPFPAPADTQAVPILIALVEGREGKSAKALARLRALEARASGATKALAATAVRVVALEAADAAYRDGKLGQARKLLGEARKAAGKVGADEVAHNLAVIELAQGDVTAAIAALEKSRVPEALVNLGIAYDRQGKAAEALDAWRRARKAGVRFAPLADWIAAKEQVYGEGAP